MFDAEVLPPEIVPALRAFAQALARHIRSRRGWGRSGGSGPGTTARPVARAGALPIRRSGSARRNARVRGCASEQPGSPRGRRSRKPTRCWRIWPGVHVGEETLRTQALHLGAQVEAAQQTQIAHVQAEHTPLPATADPAPGNLLVETDGVMVRYRAPAGSTWHEVKLGLVAGCHRGNGHPTHAPTHCLPVLAAPSYVAAREPAEQFGPRLLAEAARRGALDVVGWEQPPGTDPRLVGVTGPSLAILREV